MHKRTILVTGANRGIGLAIVRELAQNSSDLILLAARKFEDATLAAKDISGNVVPVELDLSSSASIEKALKTILAAHPQIDVLINNAGILEEGNLETGSLQGLETSLQIHLKGPYQLIKALLPGMKKNHYGRIVNISSGWGSFNEGLTGPCAYSVSKAALNALTLTLSHELPSYIKVNSMCPGWVKTRMGGEAAPRSPREGAETAIWLANLTDEGPSGKLYRDKTQINW